MRQALRGRGVATAADRGRTTSQRPRWESLKGSALQQAGVKAVSSRRAELCRSMLVVWQTLPCPRRTGLPHPSPRADRFGGPFRIRDRRTAGRIGRRHNRRSCQLVNDATLISIAVCPNPLQPPASQPRSDRTGRPPGLRAENKASRVDRGGARFSCTVATAQHPRARRNGSLVSNREGGS
jgi:hypothetical protein